MTDNSSEQLQTLGDLNRAEVVRSVFLITFMCLIPLAGIPGNLFVCFTNKPRNVKSMSRYFIFWLAVSDTIGSGTVILELVTVCMPYIYPSEWLCKLTVYFEMGTVMMSSGLLTTISIDRYRRVCLPHRRQIREFHARIIIIILCVSAIIFSMPVFEFYGIREFSLRKSNATGHDCEVRNQYVRNIYFRVYGGFLMICFLTSLIIMVSIYALIGKQICVRMGTRGSVTSRSSSSGELSSQTSPAFRSSVNSREKLSNQRCSGQQTDNVTLARVSSRSGNDPTKTSRIRRSVFIMFLITVVFIVSFVPNTTLRMLQATRDNFVSSLSDFERAVFKFFLRVYFLNFMVNPFIYGACLPRFRKDLKLFWNRICTH